VVVVSKYRYVLPEKKSAENALCIRVFRFSGFPTTPGSGTIRIENPRLIPMVLSRAQPWPISFGFAGKL
jgi:hypothetical protein